MAKLFSSWKTALNFIRSLDKHVLVSVSGIRRVTEIEVPVDDLGL